MFEELEYGIDMNKNKNQVNIMMPPLDE